MNDFIQRRVQQLQRQESQPMMMARGGEVFDIEDPETMAEASMAMDQPVTDPNAELRAAMEELMLAQETAEDPFEAQKAQQLMNAAQIGSEAPMGTMAMELSEAGRGGDTMLAHLTPGEVILPLGMMDDPDFERAVENRFNQLDLAPEEYVAGLGIASLNPITGLEEFGFFKKIAKGVKKVVKKVVRPIASVAQFVPGPWQPAAALIARAGTVYDVAKGNASPLALASLAAPMPGGGAGAGKGISGLFSGAKEFVTKGADGVGLFGNIGKGISSLGTDLKGLVVGGGADGVGSFGRLGDVAGDIGEYIMPGQDDRGLFSNLGRDVLGMQSGQQAKPASEILGELTDTNPELISVIEDGITQGLSPEEVLAQMQQSGAVPSGGIFQRIGTAISGTPGQQTPFQEFLDDQLGIDPSGGGIFNVLQGGQGGQGQQAGGLGGLLGGGGGGGLGMLGAAGLAGLIGKLAYDEAKGAKGVDLTPLVTMNAAGRFNLENEIARRAGTERPNPVEFGLLPEGTLPVMSGGRAPTQAQAQLEEEKTTGMRYGGPVMAFAEGGNVDEEDFKRMNGDINGPGTEISDDIPAMLSDGEFVMTGRAVRGAGAFNMKNKNGIITLTPTKGESRDRGTKLMYEMMDLFKEFADAPEAAA